MNRSIKERNALVEEHQAYARLVANTLYRRSPAVRAVGDREDVYQIGLLGLIDAAERFDPARGFQFKTYALPRIRGQILDAARGGAMVKVPRSAQLRGEPIGICRQFGATVERGDPADLRRQVPAADQIAEAARPERLELRDEIRQLLRPLLLRQRAYLKLYFGLCGEPLSMREVAAVHGISESRISQEITKALAQLGAPPLKASGGPGRGRKRSEAYCAAPTRLASEAANEDPRAGVAVEAATPARPRTVVFPITLPLQEIPKMSAPLSPLELLEQLDAEAITTQVAQLEEKRSTTLLEIDQQLAGLRVLLKAAQAKNGEAPRRGGRKKKPAPPAKPTPAADASGVKDPELHRKVKKYLRAAGSARLIAIKTDLAEHHIKVLAVLRGDPETFEETGDGDWTLKQAG